MTVEVLVIALVLGLLFGSFLNVVVHRVPIMMEREWRAQCAEFHGEKAEETQPYNLVVPRSACPHCGHLIAWYENIPLLSYLRQKGRCSRCGVAISWRYPLLEAVTGLLTVLTVWHFGPTGQAALALLLVWGLLALTFIDFETHLLPDSLTQPLIWIGLLANLNGLFVPLEEALIGAVAGYLSLRLVYHLFKLVTGKEGMGFGDFKLLAALGAWMGWKVLPLIILASSLVGAVVGVALILVSGHDRAKPIPFGPYLALAGLLVLFLGRPLMDLYLAP
ncbi:MAG TPA: A24 family peptidase [Thiobacillaceae bacterium]|nr:A24 family peptidase [Thiobacillaceae bacterium]